MYPGRWTKVTVPGMLKVLNKSLSTFLCGWGQVACVNWRPFPAVSSDLLSPDIPWTCLTLPCRGWALWHQFLCDQQQCLFCCQDGSSDLRPPTTPPAPLGGRWSLNRINQNLSALIRGPFESGALTSPHSWGSPFPPWPSPHLPWPCSCPIPCCLQCLPALGSSRRSFRKKSIPQPPLKLTNAFYPQIPTYKSSKSRYSYYNGILGFIKPCFTEFFKLCLLLIRNCPLFF